MKTGPESPEGGASADDARPSDAHADPGARTSASALAAAITAEPPEPATESGQVRARAETTPVSQVMVRDVACLSLEADTQSAIEMFLDRDVSHAPVVDAAWRPLGMVSKTDLLRAFDAVGARPEAIAARIAGVLSPQVITVHEDAPVGVAAALMAHAGVHCLPVVAAGGEVVGVVSSLDVVRWLARETGMQLG